MGSTSYGKCVGLYFSARSVVGHDPKSARVIAMYHIYVGDNAAKACSTAELALAAYPAAAAEARQFDPRDFRAEILSHAR